MINMKYQTWHNVCSGIFNQSKSLQNKYLQLYPFTKLSEEDKSFILSEDFFNRIIKNGALFKNKLSNVFLKHYIQKSDSSFRNAKLVSPLIFLYIECIGYHVFKSFVRESNNTRCYYAGNMDELDFHYKKSYDNYYIDVNESSQWFQYYYKFDVNNFFDNIEINLLFDLINKRTSIIDSRTALIYKRLLQSIGDGRYPTVESSSALSFLATYVYLDLFDSRLENFLADLFGEKNFQIIRFVDDLIIFFNAENDFFYEAISSIKNFVILNYRDFNLSINEQKSNYGNSENVSEELSAAFYDHYVNEQDINIGEFFDGNNVKDFIEKLNEIADNHTHDKYREIKTKVFKITDVQYNANEIFTYLLYYKKDVFKNKGVIDSLSTLIMKDYKIINYDTKNFITMIINTSDGNLIRYFLNLIFNKDELDAFDITIIINYLLLRNFNHRDLLDKLSHHDHHLYEYSILYCKESFFTSFLEQEKNTYINLLINGNYDFHQDLKVWYIYFMFQFHKNNKDMLEAFSYFKSYFERISAHLMYFKNIHRTRRDKPDYQRYYRLSEVKKDYKELNLEDYTEDELDNLIESAHDLRNHNPINHASAQVMDNETLNLNEIESVITKIEALLEKGFEQSIS